jgi:hypothetical protein
VSLDGADVGSDVRTDRWRGRAIGVLFIVASVAAIVGGLLLLPVTDADAGAPIVDPEVGVPTGAVIELVLVLSVVGIAAYLFPVLRRRDEGLALGYLGARILEAVLLLAATMTALVTFSLFDSGAAASQDPTGELLLAARHRTYYVGSQLVFGVTAVILNVLLHRARLVPAWISIWGLIGGGLIVIRGLLDVYGIAVADVLQGLLVAPIGLQEMVLALWLILRGFGPRPGPAPTERAT